MYATNECTKKRYQEYTPTNLTVYEYLASKSDPFMDLSALSFYGKKTSYRELFEQIDRAERSLRALGIGKDDIVAVSLPGSPEAVALLYAINKIGALYCAFDCRARESEILEMLERFNPKLCIIPNFQLKSFKAAPDTRVVYIFPAHSIGGVTRVMEFFVDLFTECIKLSRKNKNFIPYPDFEKLGENEKSLPPAKATDNIFGYFYTSGTTYGRKSIILTNENINSSVYQTATGEANLHHAKPGEIMLNVMPLFTCYSVTNAVQLPLSVGVQVTLIPIVKIKKMKKLILHEKPNYIISVPAHWEYFGKENFDGCDLSFLKFIIVGGDKINPDYEDKINKILKDCNSKTYLHVAYGMSETTSIGAMPQDDTPKGSVGLPFICMKIKICDTETGKELPPYERGEICMIGPNICRGYYKDQKMTDMLLRYHDDGQLWLHSGDVGYKDENGNLFFCERMKYMYVRFDGTKVSPFTIEKLLCTSPIVDACMVVAIKDTEHSHGMCAKAVVVLKDGVKQNSAVQQLEKYAHNHLGRHMTPKEFVFVEKLPYTKNGKLDYVKAAELKNS